MKYRTIVPSFDLGSFAQDLERKTTVRLHPRRGLSGPLHSKLGGVIAWPAAEEWPRCAKHDVPAVALLQLTRDDVPEIVFAGDTDLFQLLWCPLPHLHHAPGAIVSWRTRERLGELRIDAPAPHPAAQKRWLPVECVLHPERVIEYPSAADLPPERVQRLDAILAEYAEEDLARLGISYDDPLYQNHFSVAPGTKVGGHVDWIQDSEWPICAEGHPMTHLLTIASAEYDGAYQRWAPETDRRMLDRPYAERQRALVEGTWPNADTGLMLGDAGDYYVFSCTRCPERPIATVCQSS